MEIPRLKEYFDSLPTLGTIFNKARPARQSSNRALKLDEDIMLEVFMYLTPEDIENAQISGATDMEAPNILWRRKVKLDFPWLWDLPNCNIELDWLRIYKDIVRFSQGKAIDIIHGLANRRRIWNVCNQLTGDNAEDIVQNSFSTGMPLVRAPASKAFTPLTAYFISSWRTLYYENKQLTVHFNGNGYLCGVSLVVNSEKEKRRLFGLEGDTEHGGKQYNLHISSSNWIDGFELNLSKLDISDKASKSGITGVKVVIVAFTKGKPY
jgi:hypothetical protein